jgi:hypothetical protein
MAMHFVEFAFRTRTAAPWKRQTVQPVTAGAWHGFFVRFEVAESAGSHGMDSVFMRSSPVFRRTPSPVGQIAEHASPNKKDAGGPRGN